MKMFRKKEEEVKEPIGSLAAEPSMRVENIEEGEERRKKEEEDGEERGKEKEERGKKGVKLLSY